MTSPPHDTARPEPEQGPDDGIEIPADNRAAIGEDQAHLPPTVNDVPQDLPLADDGHEPMRLRVPDPAGRMRLRVRYSEGDMRLRVRYPDKRAETPSALVIRSRYDAGFVLFLLGGGFLALMAWAANAPPPDGDVGSARFLGVLALGLFVAAWRYASLGLLRATKKGIVVHGFVSRRRIPWADLLDVTFPAGVLVLETNDEAKGRWPLRPRDLAGDFVVEQVSGDAHDRDNYLHFVRTALLAMRDQYAATPRAQPDIQDS